MDQQLYVLVYFVVCFCRYVVLENIYALSMDGWRYISHVMQNYIPAYCEGRQEGFNKVFYVFEQFILRDELCDKLGGFGREMILEMI